MSDDEDPEVIADMRLRALTELDTTRTRPVDVNTLWSPPVFVAEWRCRFPGPPPCRVLIPVDADTVEKREMFNAHLIRTGDPDGPIATHEVLVCDAHKRMLREHRDRVLPRLHTELRDAIQKIKASDRPRQELKLIEILKKRHHPDIEGLLQALEEKLGGKRKARSL